MSSVQSTSEEKLAEMLLILADGIKDQPSGGATKLNKLAFYAEFTHMRMVGQAITGVEYQRIEHGPAPRCLTAVRSKLIEQDDAEIRHEARLGLMQHRLVPLRAPRRELFTESELSAIDEVLDTLGAKSARELTDMSHAEPMWNLVEDGDAIPLETAFLRRGHVTKRIERRARELAEQHQAHA